MGKELPTYAELTAMPLTSDWPDLAPADQFRDRGVHIPTIGEVTVAQLILSGKNVTFKLINYCQQLLREDNFHCDSFNVVVARWNDIPLGKREEASQIIFNAVAVVFASAFHATTEQWLNYTGIFSSAAYQMKAMAEAATPA